MSCKSSGPNKCAAALQCGEGHLKSDCFVGLFVERHREHVVYPQESVTGSIKISPQEMQISDCISLSEIDFIRSERESKIRKKKLLVDLYIVDLKSNP